MVTGGTGHNKTELLSLSTWSWQKRAQCPLSHLERVTPALFRNGYFYVFGDKIVNENITLSAVARFDPFKNDWKIIGDYGNRRERHQVINTDYGVVIVGGNGTNEQSRLCQMSESNVECEDMGNHDAELIRWNENVVLFAFDATECPDSVERHPAMLFLSTYSPRNELIRGCQWWALVAVCNNM